MRRLAMVVALLCATSCTLVQKAEDTLESGQRILGKAEKTVDNVEKITATLAKIAADAKATVDTDGDGKGSLQEWLVAILGALGVGGFALAKSVGSVRSEVARVDAKRADGVRSVHERVNDVVAALPPKA